jgi:HPt (histidine-containing phosphotransfer) domain-containing protein
VEAHVEEAAAPATPPVTAELPEIDGLDLAEGLAWSDGNPKTYLKSLERFSQEQTGIPEKIRDALVQGEPAAAERMAQSLKTAAGDIGAGSVQKAATALAHAIHGQTDPSDIEFLWADLEKVLNELLSGLRQALKSKEDKPSPARRLPPQPPVNPAQLRKAVNLIAPLFAGQDPGAKECLKDNRATFRSAFVPEAYVEFEQCVKKGDFDAALEQLKKAVKKYGISV